MSSVSPEYWAKLLWAYFSPQISTGRPFFLAVDSNLLVDLAGENSTDPIVTAQILQKFNTASNSLIEKQGRTAILKNPNFLPVSGETFSNAIVLAVQQVLVVENMLRDALFSEHSYFPRYRELLELENADKQLCPMSSEHFHGIWNQLRREILLVKGATEKSITFTSGLGRDRNRQLPISQALFTTHDLAMIASKCANYSFDSDEVIFQYFYRYKRILGKRAQNLLSRNDRILLHRLADQFRNYVAAPQTYSIESVARSTSQNKSKGTFVAFLDEGLLTDTISFYFRTDDGNHIGVDEDVAILKKHHSEAQPGLLFIGTADGFEQISREDQINETNSILYIYHKAQKAREERRIAQTFGDQWQNRILTHETNLPSDYIFHRLDDVTAAEVRFVLGEKTTLKEISSKLNLAGGLCIDGRSKKFLEGYPPEELKLNESLVATDSEIKVNGELVKSGEFFSKLRNKKGFEAFKIELDQESIEFAIVHDDPLRTVVEKFGFKISAEGKANPVVLPVDPEDSHLAGVLFSDDPRKTNGITETCIAALLSKGGKQIDLDEEKMNRVIAKIENLVLNLDRVNAIKDKLSSTRKIRVTPETLTLLN